MRYELDFNKAFLHQLERLPGNVRAIARERIANLCQEPCPTDSKELDGHPNYYRLWLDGKYRLVWYLDEAEKLIHLRYVAPKTPDLYATLGLGRSNTGIDNE